MAKRGLKIFGIGLGTLVVLAGIIVGILFGTGVIKVPPKGDNTAPADEKDIIHPTKYCGIPNIVSFTQNTYGSYTLRWTPGIQQQCIDTVIWSYSYTIKTDEGFSRGIKRSFYPKYWQASLDIDLGGFPPSTKTIEGTIQLEGVPKDGTGGIKKSNEYSYLFSVNRI